MDEIHVTGKASLSGEIFIQGSKNAALPMIAASLMHRGLSILRDAQNFRCFLYGRDFEKSWCSDLVGRS